MERYEIVADDEGKYCGVIPSENGSVVKYADAQTTVEALQARLQELEEITTGMCGHCCEALRDERDRLRAALGQATIALRYYAKTAISARAVEALEKMEKAQVFACFYCSQDHVWLASQDGWHATKKEGVKVRCEAKAALTPAAKGGDDD